MNDLDYNWALTLGNHDHQADLTPQQIHQLDMSYERSLTKPNAGEISHATNYILPIYDPTGTQIMARIWMFDSGDNGCMGTDGWGCMMPDQIQWFREESQKIPLDDPLRSHGLAFFHIPTFEWMDLYNNFPIHGGKGEPVCCSSQNTGMWSAWKEQGTIEYAFVGHDHTNDYWGNNYRISLGLLATVTFGLSTKNLKFTEDGTFKICQITDTHFGKDESNNKATQNVIRTVLKSEDPNIVVITGDIISGYEWDNTQGWYAENYDQVVAPMNELDYNWAITIGNHDHQADLNPEEIRKLDMSYERSMTKSSVHNISHTFNYILPIYDSTETQIVARIWMFDVGSQDCYGVNDWDCIKPDQIEWYRRESQKIPLDDPNRSHGFAFFHIPTQEWDDLYNNFPVYGGKGEQVLCPTINTGLFAAFKEQGTVEYAFVGHDHTNDYWGNFYGVNLGFGRRTGVGDFKQQGKKIKVGGRIFELQLNPWKVDTWIRNLDGEQEIQQKKKHPNYEFKITQVQAG